MLSRELLREQPDRVRELLASRGIGPEALDSWLELDQKRRTSLVELEELKRRRNEASKEIGRIKQQGGDAAAQIEEVAQLKGRIAELEEVVGGVETDLAELELGFPNLPHDTVPVGEDESANRVERVVGEPRKFDFEPKAHWDLGPELGILDFERGANIAGARFTAYFGAGARLERALINFMLELHTTEHGYIETLPPFIVNSAALVGTGQLPKFAEDLFRLEGHDYYLVPTAEVPVTNLHRDETLEEAQLPLRYAAFTPCFRAEAGSYGKDVRGLIRQHQFNKVELVHLATRETSWDELEILTANAEKVLQLLELPYRVVTLSTGDMSFASAKTYDLEVWLPA
ncbi:MAG: serine--tRNA ligase, partial [Thermoanaerobaculia bacterium]